MANTVSAGAEMVIVAITVSLVMSIQTPVGQRNHHAEPIRQPRGRRVRANTQPAISAVGGSAAGDGVIVGDAVQVPVVVNVHQPDRDLRRRRGVLGVVGVHVPEVVVGVADVQRGRAFP